MITIRASLFGYVSGAFSLFTCGALVFANEPEKANSDFDVKEVRIDLNQLKKAIASTPDSEVNAGASSNKMMQAEGSDSEISRLINENIKLRQERDSLKKQNSGLAIRREISKALATVKLRSDKDVAGSKILCLAANDKLETLDVRLFNAEGVLLPSLFFQWRVVAEENETRNDDENRVSGQAVSQSAETAHKDPASSAEGAESSSETEKRNDIAGALSEIKNASNKLSFSLGGETEIQVTLKSDSAARVSIPNASALAGPSGGTKCLNVVCAEDVSQAIYQQAIKPWEVFYSVVEGDDKSFLRQWVQIANFTAYPWEKSVNVTLSNLGADNVIESKSFSLDHRLEADNAAIKVVEHMEIHQHEYSIDLDSTYKEDGSQAKAISREFVILKERPAFLPVGNYREDFRFEAYSRDVNREGRSDTQLDLGAEPKTYAIFDVKPTDLPPRPLRIFAGFVELLEFQQFNIDLYHDDVHRRSLGSVSLLKQRSAGWNLEDSGWNKITRNGSIFYTRSISSPSPLQKINLTESKISRIDFNKSKDNEEDFAKLEKASKTLDSSVPSDVKSAIKELVDAQNGINRNKKRARDLEAQAGELGKKYDTINLGTDNDANASRRAQLRVIWEAQQELLRTKAQLEVENARLEGVIDSILFPFVSNS